VNLGLNNVVNSALQEAFFGDLVASAESRESTYPVLCREAVRRLRTGTSPHGFEILPGTLSPEVSDCADRLLACAKGELRSQKIEARDRYHFFVLSFIDLPESSIRDQFLGQARRFLPQMNLEPLAEYLDRQSRPFREEVGLSCVNELKFIKRVSFDLHVDNFGHFQDPSREFFLRSIVTLAGERATTSYRYRGMISAAFLKAQAMAREAPSNQERGVWREMVEFELLPLLSPVSTSVGDVTLQTGSAFTTNELLKYSLVEIQERIRLAKEKGCFLPPSIHESPLTQDYRLTWSTYPLPELQNEARRNERHTEYIISNRLILQLLGKHSKGHDE
jgi:hypothetical protein